MYKNQKTSLLLLFICLQSLSTKSTQYSHLVVDNKYYSLQKAIREISPNPTKEDIKKLINTNLGWLLIKITGLESHKIKIMDEDLKNNNLSNYARSKIFSHMTQDHPHYSKESRRRLSLLEESYPNDSFINAVKAINKELILSAMEEFKQSQK